MMFIGVAIGLAAQAAQPDFREAAVRSALMESFQGKPSEFAKFVTKGAKIIDLEGRSSTLDRESLRRFTTECSLFNWGDGDKDPNGNWLIEWECPKGEYIGMSFRFRDRRIAQVELLQAPPLVRPPSEYPYRYAAVRFPQTLNEH